MRHKWKKLKPTTKNATLLRKCTACGIEYREELYGRYKSKMWRQPKGTWKLSDYNPVPKCSAMKKCEACDGKGLVPA